MQPKARSAEVLWQLLAAPAPDSEIYQLEHGNALVTLGPLKKGSTAVPVRDVQASAKIPEGFSTVIKGNKEDEDPGASFGPWSTPQKFARSSAAQPVTKSDLDAMEERVETKLRNSFAKPRGEDTIMATEDESVANREQRMSKL